MNSAATSPAPIVSVVVVNYNCKKWLERFFPSIRAQTVFDRIEVVIVDNTSTDGSAEICQKEIASWPNGVFLATGGNYGFGGGSNRGAAIARGKFLFFINPDVRLEPDCLEELVKHTESAGGSIASPRVLDYDSDDLQSQGAAGFDAFGCMTKAREGEFLSEPFAVAAFYFITQELLRKLGGFDEEFFLYNEEMDLSWRAWLAGETIRQVPSAKIHHQGASSGDRHVENRTNETKRFYANRNQLLTILKNARFLLLFLAVTQVSLIAAEAIAGAVLARRFSFARWSLLKPLADCWRLRGHVGAERRQICSFRKRGDLWILHRFFTFRFGRWMDIQRLLKSGVKIDRARGATGKK
ncbi:MAG TPA: glycosyltransferase family 2 protein [Candidatus Polarisedimenticolia bacterium]|nr:glycosyltransferase family 2 protein [Candidatus Polarisedimenticolia bacterium]